jgi:hypothetical protein
MLHHRENKFEERPSLSSFHASEPTGDRCLIWRLLAVGVKAMVG